MTEDDPGATHKLEILFILLIELFFVFVFLVMADQLGFIIVASSMPLTVIGVMYFENRL